jgi:hypothetical protein
VIARDRDGVEHGAMGLLTINEDVGKVAGHERSTQCSMKQARVTPLGIPERRVRSISGRFAAGPEIEQAAQPAERRYRSGRLAPEGERPRLNALVHRLPVFLRSSVAAGRCRCTRGRAFTVLSLPRLPCTAVFRSSASSSVRSA